MLKDPLQAGAGFGDVVISEANVTIDNYSLSVTSGALNFSKAEVKIAGKTGTVGEIIKNVKSGNQTITITIPSTDGKKSYSGTKNIAIKANEKISVSIIINTEKNSTNVYKFILTEAKYNELVKGDQAANIDFADIIKVTLAGEMNSWSNTSGAYTLVKQEDNSWLGYFPISEGTNFKFIVSTATESNKWTKDNLTVQENAGLITQNF